MRHDSGRWALGICLSGLILLRLLAGMGEAVAADDYPRIFRFGVINLLAGVNAKDAQVAIEMNIVNRNKAQFPGITAKIELLKDVAAADDMLKRQRLHALALSSTDYLALSERWPLIPLFVSSQQARPLEAYVVLVRQRVANLEQLRDLPRRRLVVEDYGQTHIGQLWLDTVLRDKGFAASRSFFSTIRPADKPARMVLPVFFGQAEACLVPQSAYDTMAELNPQIGQQLKVLLRSPGFVRSVTCARKDLNARLVEALKRNAVNMPLTVDGQQLMMIFRYKRHFLFDPDYMQETLRVYRRYHSKAAGR